MTRINCVDPKYLSDRHLGAEYRELPRVVGLVLKAISRGERPDDPRNPSSYVLGPGHVRFFYSKMEYLSRRYALLCEECKRRGRLVTFSKLPSASKKIPREWWNDWVPTEVDKLTNIVRLNERSNKEERQ